MIVGTATLTIVASMMIIATPSAMKGIASHRRGYAGGEAPLALAASNSGIIAVGFGCQMPT
jgi:hypothetical protein